MTLTSQIIRIVVRYLAGFLVAKGLLDTGTGEALATDSALLAGLELAIGGALAVVNETWFARSVRKEQP
jgi:hypothetical protein